MPPVDGPESPRPSALLTDVLRTLAEQLEAAPVDERALAAVDELVQAATAELHRLRHDSESPLMTSPARTLGPLVLSELIKRSRAPHSESEPLVDARR